MARERSKNREGSQSLERRHGGQVSPRQSWPTVSPFGMMRRFADEMDRVFEGVGFPRMERIGPWMEADEFSTQVDIFERDGKLVVRADLPGMTKDDVTVELTDDSLVIEGERKYEHEENKEGVFRSERRYGRFHREIALPDGVKADTARANFHNGVLEISLDAPQASKNRKRIDIQGDANDGKPGQTAA